MFILMSLIDSYHAGLFVEQTVHLTEAEVQEQLDSLPPTDAFVIRCFEGDKVRELEMKNAFGGKWYPISNCDFTAAFGGYSLEPGQIARIEIGKPIQYVPEKKKSFLRFFRAA